MEWLALTYIISVQYIALLVWEYNLGHGKTWSIIVTRRPIAMRDYYGNCVTMQTHATNIAKYSATMVSLNKSQQLGIEIHYTLEGANLCVKALTMLRNLITTESLGNDVKLRVSLRRAVKELNNPSSTMVCSAF